LVVELEGFEPSTQGGRGEPQSIFTFKTGCAI